MPDDDSGLGPDLMPYESGRRNKKARHVKLAAVRLIGSSNRAAAKRIHRNGRGYGRSERKVLDFGEMDPEEAADESERVGRKKARFHAFNLRRLGHNGRRLRFSFQALMASSRSSREPSVMRSVESRYRHTVRRTAAQARPTSPP